MTAPARTTDVRGNRDLPAIAAAALATASAILLYTGTIARPGSHEGSAFELFILLASLLGLLWLTLTAPARSRRGSKKPLSPELKATLDAVPAFVMCTTSDGDPCFVNRRALEYLGMAEEEVRAAKYAFVHPEDRDAAETAWEKSVSTGEPYKRIQRLRAADGTYRWFQVQGEPMRGRDRSIQLWCGVWNDVDDRVRTEQALRANEERFRQILDTIPALIFCASGDGKLSYLNKGTLDYTGVTIDRLAEYNYIIIHPDDVPHVSAAWANSVHTGTPYSQIHRIRDVRGEYRWFQIRAEALRDQTGNVTGWFGVSTDIDEQRRGEVNLKHSEQRLQLIIDTIPALVWSAAPDFTPLYLNKRVMGFMGTKLDKYSEYDWTTTMHPEDVARTRAALSESLQNGNAFRILHRLRRADGEYRWMDTRADALRDENGQVVCWYGIDVDVHERVQLQEANTLAQARLAKASEVAMVAEISASLAHEINQPLAAIVSNADACQRWLTSDPPNPERARLTAERLRRDALSAADLVERIRKLFRRAPPSRIPLDINAAIRETLELVADRLESNRILVHTSLDGGLPQVSADHIQLQQVLVNLIMNAIEATPSVQDNALRRLELHSQLLNAREIAIEVRDQGTGLAAADRIFEPFFSTKSHGMGMGLAICRSIIEAHGGRLSAHANPVRGSTFRLTLPLDPDEAA